MTVGNPLAAMRWMANREMIICGVINRICRPGKVKIFTVPVKSKSFLWR